MVAVAGSSAWYDFMSKEMPSASASDLTSRYQSEEGGAHSTPFAAPSTKRYRNSSSPPTMLALTDASHESPLRPTPPTADADKRSPRDYDLPIHP